MPFRTSLAIFSDEYYMGSHLYLALGYQPPNEFERGLGTGTPSGAACMQFFRPAQDQNREEHRKARKALTPKCANANLSQ
jgi:hypothetical protein